VLLGVLSLTGCAISAGNCTDWQKGKVLMMSQIENNFDFRPVSSYSEKISG